MLKACGLKNIQKQCVYLRLGNTFSFRVSGDCKDRDTSFNTRMSKQMIWSDKSDQPSGDWTTEMYGHDENKYLYTTRTFTKFKILALISHRFDYPRHFNNACGPQRMTLFNVECNMIFLNQDQSFVTVFLCLYQFPSVNVTNELILGDLSNCPNLKKLTIDFVPPKILIIKRASNEVYG